MPRPQLDRRVAALEARQAPDRPPVVRYAVDGTPGLFDRPPWEPEARPVTAEEDAGAQVWVLRYVDDWRGAHATP